MRTIIIIIMFFQNRQPLVLNSLVFLLVWAFSATATSQQNAAEVQHRIVSAGGSVTEILYALGLGEQVVAVDSSSLYPQDATQKPQVGYYRQLSPEGVLAQSPSLLIGHRQMGPEQVLTQIERAGVEVLHLKQQATEAGLFQLITDIAAYFAVVERGHALVTQIKQELAEANASSVDADEAPSKVAFLVSVGERGLQAAGQNTVPHMLIGRARSENVFNEIQGYKPVSGEALLTRQPDLILLPLHAAAGQTPQQLCQTASLKLWADLNGCHVYFVDALTFMGLTPRYAEAVQQLRHMLKHGDSPSDLVAAE